MVNIGIPIGKRTFKWYNYRTERWLKLTCMVYREKDGSEWIDFIPSNHKIEEIKDE